MLDLLWDVSAVIVGRFQPNPNNTSCYQHWHENSKTSIPLNYAVFTVG